MGGRRGRGAWHVLGFRDFRLIALGNAVSQLGFWAQYVGVGWAARSLTDSSFLITVAFASQFVPSLFLSPVAGVLADRYDRRRLIMLGNLAMVGPPLVIGLLLQADRLTLPTLIAFVMLGGAGQSFTQPATMAFVPALVPREDVPSAIAINSGLTNSTRVMGPALAGVLIGAWGVSFAFYANAISFLAVTFACVLVRVRPPALGSRGASVRTQLRAGARYVRSNAAVFRLMTLVGVLTFLMMHSALMPVFATKVLHGDASTYAFLSAAPGIGTLVGVAVAARLQRPNHRLMGLVGAAGTMGVALLVVSLSRNVLLTGTCLAVWGMAFFITQTLATTMLIVATVEEYRGRVMGVYGMVTGGILPISSVTGGVIASFLGPPLTVTACSVSILAVVTTFCLSGGIAAVRSGTAEKTPGAAIA